MNRAPRCPGGKYVLYWMQQSQRAVWNDALEYAVSRANEAGLPVLVCFGLMDNYPDANERHYYFMLEGLADAADALQKRGIAFTLQHGHPADVALQLSKQAALLVMDRGYLRHQVEWRRKVADDASCEVVQIEADVIVPVEIASNKAEIGARTLRPKIWRHAPQFLTPLRETPVKNHFLDHVPRSLDVSDPNQLCARLKLNRSVGRVDHLFHGGATEAVKAFRVFLSKRAASYAEHRNHPETNDVSHMSKYLHFGQVSPVWLAIESERMGGEGRQNQNVFIEELLVRRELAMNFVTYVPHYDSLSAAPAWARDTLATHSADARKFAYAAEQLEGAETHDPYWNAAMLEMRHTGYMHNYMRMYWGKKILEWSRSPEEAHATTLALNNKYFLDGRDPNSYGNVSWLFGTHDRPWPERPIYGKVRSMTAGGLERKCDIRAYCEKVRELARLSPE